MTVCVKSGFRFVIVILFILALPNFCFANTNDEREVIAINFLKVSSLDLNFAFTENEVFEFETREDLQNFWQKNSRIIDATAPEFPINWEDENIMMIVWKSIDDIIRIPSLSSFSVTKNGLELDFFLTTPCFGIITDASPTAFLSISKEKRKSFEQVRVQSSSTKQKCF